MRTATARVRAFSTLRCTAVTSNTSSDTFRADWGERCVNSTTWPGEPAAGAKSPRAPSVKTRHGLRSSMVRMTRYHRPDRGLSDRSGTLVDGDSVSPVRHEIAEPLACTFHLPRRQDLDQESESALTGSRIVRRPWGGQPCRIQPAARSCRRHWPDRGPHRRAAPPAAARRRAPAWADRSRPGVRPAGGRHRSAGGGSMAQPNADCPLSGGAPVWKITQPDPRVPVPERPSRPARPTVVLVWKGH